MTRSNWARRPPSAPRVVTNSHGRYRHRRALNHEAPSCGPTSLSAHPPHRHPRESGDPSTSQVAPPQKGESNSRLDKPSRSTMMPRADSRETLKTCILPLIVSIIWGAIVGIVDDILKALDRIPLWKRLGQVPDEVDDLQRRVASLEEKLNGKWPPDVCRYCGARAVRLMDHKGPDTTGVITELWSCGECQQVDRRRVKPA
jgi:hypothetical protein